MYLKDWIWRQLHRPEWWLLAILITAISFAAWGPQAPPDYDGMTLYEVTPADVQEFLDRTAALDSGVVEAKAKGGAR